MNTAANRIICIGNRYLAEDCAGPMTYDELQTRQIPEGLEVIDGGLAGLDLLPCLEDARRVVFVDSLLDSAGELQILRTDDPALQASPNYGHGAGLGFVLKLVPEVLEGEIPEIFVVAVPGQPDAVLIKNAADTCLALAMGELKQSFRTTGGAQ